MDYFWIRQDKRFLHTPVIKNVRDIVLKREFVTVENMKMIADVNVVFASSQKQMDFVDVLDDQLFLVRDQVKEIFEIYEPAMTFKMVCVLANFTGEYGNYYIPVLPKMDCLSAKSVISPDKSRVKKLVLNPTQVGTQSIFKVAGLRTDVTVIRLDVLESLLRRKIKTYKADSMIYQLAERFYKISEPLLSKALFQFLEEEGTAPNDAYPSEFFIGEFFAQAQLMCVGKSESRDFISRQQEESSN